jgi:DNA-binding MarR family transcriptional regulator
VRDEKTGQVMSQNQASILDHLDDTEGTALFDLARHMGVTASTMSLTVDRLERGGWVKRERSKQDARRVELRLTDDGVRIKKQRKVLEPALVDAMLARLEDGKRKKALRGLELLAEASRELVESGEMTRILRGVA